VSIPPFIQRLTGISNAMVSAAPAFAEFASQVPDLLSDSALAARDVRFDHRFPKSPGAPAQ
jgi:DNA polymerase-3 subunit epsilon